ncbi:MAG: 30S ribosomal protein S6 [Patescibacteria group bacterium]|nr:30S ribosomal protein S6 [Patescibacteria group bacterium]
MNDQHDRQAVYEIGYLLIGSIPEEQVPAEADRLRKMVADSSSSILAEEAPHQQALAYTMQRKTVSGSYERYDRAYFGWIKFEAEPSKVEALKKAIEAAPSVLRMLLISTTRENTYLGKRAQAIAASSGARRSPSEGAAGDEKKETAAPATIEEMDKSIEELIK